MGINKWGFSKIGSVGVFILFLTNAPSAQVTNFQKFALASGSDSERTEERGDGFFVLNWKSQSSISDCVDVVRKLSPLTHIVRISNCNKELLDGVDTIVPANNLWKLSPKLEAAGIKPERGTKIYLVGVLDEKQFTQDLELLEVSDATRINRGSYYLRLTHHQVQALLERPSIYFIDDRTVQPHPESPQRNLDLNVNRVRFLQHQHPGLRGSSRVISLKETLFDVEDIDFKGRIVLSDLTPQGVTTHATNMATMMMGAGNSKLASRGVAPGASITATDFFQLMPDTIDHFELTGASIQNHSYGVGIENYYGMDAQAYDQQVANYPYLVHVFSAGNYGDSTSRAGPYQGVPGFANLTGNFKMAKNVLVVGAVDTIARLADRSSRGPAFDGRVKPDLVAYGQDGSSGSAAIASGLVSLIQEAYHKQYLELPDAALIKALLISSAEDIHLPGPDFLTGFGNIHAGRTIENLAKGNFFQDEISAGEIQEFEFDVPDGTSSFNITLSWIDPPSSLNTHIALVNDLDLTLNDPSGNEWKPWVLNTKPLADSLMMPAVRGRDSLNNVEQISLSRPMAGTYKATVGGRLIPNGSQRYSAAFSSIPMNHFQWTYPTKGSILQSGDAAYLRWDCTYGNQIGRIEYKSVSNQNWELLDSVMVPIVGHIKWMVPTLFNPAQIRMILTDTILTSDTFMISPTPRLNLGFDCVDSLLLFWTGVDSSASYQLLSLGDEVMEPIGVPTPDTLAVLIGAGEARHYSVEPVHPSGFPGARSQTINLDFQAAGCYIDNFLADLEADQVRLRLSLGTVYGVQEIFFEKIIDGAFTRIHTAMEANTLIQHQDQSLRDGANIYRAGVKLVSGEVIHSDEVLIRYTSKDFLISPNPVYRNVGFSIVSKKADKYEFTLYDFLGRTVLSEELFSRLEFINTERLSPGVYFYTIENTEGALAEGTLILQ